MNSFDISTTLKPTAQELRDLFEQTTWAQGRSAKDIQVLLNHLDVFVCVRTGGRLVGFGRAISDGVYRALLDDIVVEREARGAGLGKTIVTSLLKQLSSVEEVFLNAGEHLTEFYSMHGFEVFGGRTMRLSSRERRVAE